ncbi:integrase catalytic domain-containing protein [Trichonephila clavipes]|nr:integrase catalytic domain-containing protein [Trichonephila clavipes]
MKTVTYGTVSSPFLATRILLQLSRVEDKSFPLAAPVLRENFYMDDVLCSAASLMEAKALKNQFSSILKEGLELHKWGSSHLELASNVIGDYEFRNPIKTKTTIRSGSRKSQDLHSERAKEWNRFLEDFNSVSSICIGRCIVHPQATKVEICDFADASEKCYGAAIYCNFQSPDAKLHRKLQRRKKERTFRCPGDLPSGDHFNSDSATTGVQIDIKSLKENNRVSAESLIKGLNPFLDQDGVLRFGGRLCNSDLNFECKFPVILPCNNKLTNLIVEYFHLKYFHVGPQALLYQTPFNDSLCTEVEEELSERISHPPIPYCGSGNTTANLLLTQGSLPSLSRTA